MTGKVPHQNFISSFHQGNFKAVRELYSLHYADLNHFCVELVKDEQEAAAIVTDTFIKLLQSRMRFDNLSNIKAFLYITTRNTCLNYLKYRKAGEPLQERPVCRVEPGAFLDADANENGLVTAVSAEIDQLPGTTRTVFQRLYCDSGYVADIAREMEMTPQDILQHKTTALQLLQQGLAKKNSSFNLSLIYFLGIVCPEQRLAAV